MIYLTKASCYGVDLNMHKCRNAENGYEKGQNYCIYAVMISRRTDTKLDKISDLLLLCSRFNKLHKTGSSRKTPPFSNI